MRFALAVIARTLEPIAHCPRDLLNPIAVVLLLPKYFDEFAQVQSVDEAFVFSKIGVHLRGVAHDPSLRA